MVDQWTADDRAAAAGAMGLPALPMFMIPNMAAGLWTTAEDYARFLRFTRRAPTMFAPAVAIEGDLAWGLGIGLDRSNGGLVAWHWGANQGVANLAMMDVATGEALIVLTNGERGGDVYASAAKARFGSDFAALSWLRR
jgi:hypothetical protein